MIYADSSALAKLVLDETESDALRQYLRQHGRVATSTLGRVEVLRAVRRGWPDFIDRAQELLGGLLLVGVDQGVLTVATTLLPTEMRTLDAIHVATALALEADLQAVVTYDLRMAEAARGAGLVVESPA